MYLSNCSLRCLYFCFSAAFRIFICLSFTSRTGFYSFYYLPILNMHSSQTDTGPLISPITGHKDLQSVLNEYGLEFTPDGQLIRWSASNKNHPRNWTLGRKIYDSHMIIFLDLFTYVIGRHHFYASRTNYHAN